MLNSDACEVTAGREAKLSGAIQDLVTIIKEGNGK